MSAKIFSKFFNSLKSPKFISWLDRFTTAFTSTVLGISITLGVGYYKENKAKENFVRKNEAMALHFIQQDVNNLESEIDLLTERMNQINVTIGKFPDSIRTLSYEECNNMILAINNYEYHVKDTYSAKVFNSSSDVWIYAKSLADIASINNLFAISDVCHQTVNDINKDLVTVRDRSLTHAIGAPTIQQAVEYIISDEDNYHILARKLPWFVKLAQQAFESYSRTCEDVIKKIGITQEELDEYDSAIELDDIQEIMY